jgi:hypothetical protein
LSKITHLESKFTNFFEYKKNWVNLKLY